MRNHSRVIVSLLVGLTFLAGLAAGSPAEARKKKRRGPPPVYVSSDATLTIFIPPRPCGAADFPCRTIQAGIEAAPDGGTVLVGPGVYGNHDFQPGLSGRGERMACRRGACGAVLVQRGVRVLSKEGAGATVVDLNGVALSAAAVTVEDGVFGAPGHGFTVRAASNHTGIVCERGSTAGNVVLRSFHGFAVYRDCTGANNIAISNARRGFTVSQSSLVGSFAIGNHGEGMAITGDSLVQASQAMGNTLAGFDVQAVPTPPGVRPTLHANLASINDSSGYIDRSFEGADLFANTALGNGTPNRTSGSGEGFDIQPLGLLPIPGQAPLSRVFDGVAVGNGHYGIRVGSGSAELIRNQLIGNYTYGIGWGSSSDGWVDRNVSFGNRICQIHQWNNGLSAATRGFWGSAFGPVGDIPTCRPPLLEPLASTPGKALTWGKKKKGKKKKSKKKRQPGVAWPLR